MMTRIRQKLVRFLPQRLKGVIRPVYNTVHRLLRRPDKSYRVRIGSFGGFSVAYREGTADEHVIASSFDHDVFFPRVPEYRPADDHVIIDIGAHIGTFALLASRNVKCGKVYAIEACESSFTFLRLNVALNSAANISMHHLAIADRPGTCRLHYDRHNWGHSTAYSRSICGETVECCTLSDFLESNNIRRCDFLKLNCEGAEFPILLSTPSSVLQRFDVIFVMYHCDLWPANTETDLLSHLKSCAFNTVVRDRSETRGCIIATNTESIDGSS